MWRTSSPAASLSTRRFIPARLGPDARNPCFSLFFSCFLSQNGNPQNPYCSGIEGVMEAYYQSLKSVRLYGPTHFSPVINHVARLVTTITPETRGQTCTCGRATVWLSDQARKDSDLRRAAFRCSRSKVSQESPQTPFTT